MPTIGLQLGSLGVLMILGAGVVRAQAARLPEEPCPVGSKNTPSPQQTANLIRAELYDSAECSARQLTSLQPASADAHFLLGYVLNRRDKPEESLKEYTTGARYGRPASHDLAIVALDYALLNDDSDAAKWMGVAVADEPLNATYWYYLGRIRYSMSAYESARSAYETALHLHPNNLRILYNLGLAYEGLGDTEKAIGLYRQAIAAEAEGQYDAQPYYDLGSLLVTMGRPDEARAMLQKAASLEPRNPAIREQLARAQERTGELDQSRNNYEAAVALAPRVRSLHFQLGRVYKKLNMTAEAKQQFDLCAASATDPAKLDESLNFTQP